MAVAPRAVLDEMNERRPTSSRASLTDIRPVSSPDRRRLAVPADGVEAWPPRLTRRRAPGPQDAADRGGRSAAAGCSPGTLGRAPGGRTAVQGRGLGWRSAVRPPGVRAASRGWDTGAGGTPSRAPGWGPGDDARPCLRSRGGDAQPRPQGTGARRRTAALRGRGGDVRPGRRKLGRLREAGTPGGHAAARQGPGRRCTVASLGSAGTLSRAPGGLGRRRAVQPTPGSPEVAAVVSSRRFPRRAVPPRGSPGRRVRPGRRRGRRGRPGRWPGSRRGRSG